MNKVLVYLLLLATTTIMAQSSLSKLEDKDGVESITVNKKMFDLMSKVKADVKDKDVQKYFALLKKLDLVEAYYTSKTKTSAEINNAAAGYLKTNPLPEIITKNESGNLIKVYGKTDAQEINVQELLVIVNGDFNGVKTSVLSVKGNFPLSDISIFLKKMNIPGGEILENLKNK
jgi:hypothetical protein